MNKELYEILYKSLKGKTLLNKYVVEDGIGYGSYGIVLRCREILGGRIVAVKRLSIEEGPYLDEKNYINEIQQMAKLYRCPNVLQFITAEKEGNIFYIVTEYAEGGNLRELIKTKRIFDEFEAIDIVEQILLGLKEAYDHKIMHRDIKPENILISQGIMKISDFGVAKAIENTAINMLTHIGTPAYMAPEQFGGKGYSFNADLYSVGIIFFELLTGNKPKDDFKERMRGKNLNIPKRIPRELRRIIYKLTNYDPKRRYQKADEVLADLYNYKISAGYFPISDLRKSKYSKDALILEHAKTRLNRGLKFRIYLWLSKQIPKLPEVIRERVSSSLLKIKPHDKEIIKRDLSTTLLIIVIASLTSLIVVLFGIQFFLKEKSSHDNFINFEGNIKEVDISSKNKKLIPPVEYIEEIDFPLIIVDTKNKNYLLKDDFNDLYLIKEGLIKLEKEETNR